jgi:XTP/dITP diphosphohydrolase
VKLLVATRNAGKAREIRELFTGLPFELVFPEEQFLEQLPEEAELERGSTYAENAVAKARYFARRSSLPTLAEDSGLEVDALHGEPGVYSARFAALRGGREPAVPEGGMEAANNALLLERLAAVPEAERTARYRCIVAYVEATPGAPHLVEATCAGRMLTAPRGRGGFGYDPLFFSTDLGMSFGEAPAAAKHRVSHRGRAIRALIEVLLRRAT